MLQTLFLSVVFAFSANTLVIKTVGSLKNHSVRSREVQLSFFMDKALEAGKNTSQLSILKADSPEMGLTANQNLREWVVFLETQGLAVADVPTQEEDAQFNLVKEHLERNPFYKNLEYNDKEIKEALHRKLRARQFVKFKRNSSVAPVTDAEAERYFNNNKARFGGTAQFADFKENIKSALNRQMIDQRMQDWYQILLRKYEAKNTITDL